MRKIDCFTNSYTYRAVISNILKRLYFALIIYSDVPCILYTLAFFFDSPLFEDQLKFIFESLARS